MHCKKATRRCPCGNLGNTAGRPCRCTAEQIARYRARISGPLLDRIDMHIEVPPVPHTVMHQAADIHTPSSANIRERVTRARGIQLARDGKPAHRLTAGEIAKNCMLDGMTKALLEQAASRLGFSARAYHRILKVARTVADLEGSENISQSHIREAIGYRLLDRRPPD